MKNVTLTPIQVINEVKTISSLYDCHFLPKKFPVQEKLLYPKFIKAKRKKSKTFWRIENGCYNLYIDDVKAKPEQKGNCDHVNHFYRHAELKIVYVCRQWRSQKFSKGEGKLFELNLHFETKVLSAA